MTINDVYKFFNFIVNTSQSGKVTPGNFNLSAERAQLEWLMDKYDQEEGNNGGWQRTQRISDSLAPFVQKSVLIVDTDGIALKPDGVNVRDAVTGEVLPEYLHV